MKQLFPIYLLIGIFAVTWLQAQGQTVFSKGTYEITRRQDGDEWVYTLYDNHAGSYIEVRQRGGLISKFVAAVNETQYAIFKEGRGNPKMMPWPNRVEGGKFTDSDGNTRNLLDAGITGNDGQGNAIHGVVQDKMWEVEEYGAGEEGVYIRCFFDAGDYSSIRDIFGSFQDYSVYTLKGNTLLIDSYTRNTSDTEFDNCGWGWHPWINAPVVPLDAPQQSSKDQCSLLMPAGSVAEIDDRKIPTGKLLNVESHDEGFYNFRNLRSVGGIDVDHFFTNLTPEPDLNYTRTVFIDYGNKVRVQFFGEYPIYPWMVIFISTRWMNDFVCIEHQTEEVNGLNTKQHLIRIPAQETGPKARIMVCADGDTTLNYKTPAALQ